MKKEDIQFLNNRKYHIKLRTIDIKTNKMIQKRTTITLPTFLCDLLSVKITGKLSSESQKEVRVWLQKLANTYDPRPNCSTSQFFQEYVTYEVTDTIVSEKARELRNIAFDESMGLVEDTKTIPMFD